MTGKISKDTRINRIHRKYFELCIFFELVRQLQSGDIYVEGSLQFDDYTRHLVSWQEYENEIQNYEALSGIPTDPEDFIEKLKSQLLATARRTGAAFPENQHARIEDGRLILSKIPKKKSPEDYPQIDQQLKERMKSINILEVLIHTEKWLNLSRQFHHFSGTDSRIANYPERFVSTLFCYGCFMGSTQTARSVRDVNRKQLAWINAHHVNEERLNEAITKKGLRFEYIDELFSESIDWELIKTHLPDMLRVVLSIKAGKITPSTILRRLSYHSRKNKLYYAFRELGRAVRTSFLLDYIHDVELRKTIFAATNKSEEFNQFSDWIAFASKVIQENLRHEQTKIIKYNQLVANLIILYNTNEMTRAFNELWIEGFDIDGETLQAFSPYRTEHINRFGSYILDMKKEVQPLKHDLRLI